MENQVIDLQNIINEKNKNIIELKYEIKLKETTTNNFSNSDMSSNINSKNSESCDNFDYN